MKKLITIVALIIFILVIINKPKNTKPITIENGSSASNISTLFGDEQAVTIRGYTGDTMEPSISRDGRYLFWNSLNDAKNTTIYYAARIDDVTFEFVGEVGGVNGKAPHLDAVPSLGLDNEFYWVSLRDYPKVLENYQHGHFKDGFVTNISPVQGDFYIREPGWLIMDAEISTDGQTLLYVDAKFGNGPVPSQSIIGMAHKSNGVFIKDSQSESIFQNINAMSGVGYAPTYSTDGLTLLFTRLEKRVTKIYISTRTTTKEPFGKPELVPIEGIMQEAPSLSYDGKVMYYHKNIGSKYQLFMMKKQSK